MANIATHQVGMTYAGSYASQILLEPMFRSDDIMRNYTVYPNVKYKQNIMMAPKLSGITALNDGCTSTNANCDPAGFYVNQKTITVSNVSVKQTQCWDEFQDQFIVESYKSGLNMPDLTGTQLADVILNRVRHGIQSDVVRNMWAGNTAAAVADCTYKWADGLWKTLSVGNAVISGSTTMHPVTATQTDEANLVTVGAVLNSVDVINLLTSVFDTAPAELQQVPASEKRMFVTPNVYNAYYGALTAVAVSGAVDYGHSEAQSGVNYERLSFRGVELVAMYEWDVAFTALTGADLPPLFTHASFTGANKNATQGCIYAAKDNLIIGSNVTDPDTQLKMFYDEVSDNMYIRSNFTMGYQYGWNSLVNGGSLVR